MNIPSAKQSPRIVDGVLMWYCGDTFSLSLKLNLTDQNGAKIDAVGSIECVFFDNCHNKVSEFVLTPNENTVTLDFTTDVTKRFPEGEYTYDIHYNGAHRTTIANNNKVVVE